MEFEFRLNDSSAHNLLCNCRKNRYSQRNEAHLWKAPQTVQHSWHLWTVKKFQLEVSTTNTPGRVEHSLTSERQQHQHRPQCQISCGCNFLLCSRWVREFSNVFRFRLFYYYCRVFRSFAISLYISYSVGFFPYFFLLYFPFYVSIGFCLSNAQKSRLSCSYARKKRNHLKHIMSIATKDRQVNVCLMELQICCYSNRKTNKRLCSVFVFINEWELIIQCRKNIKLDLANCQRSLIFDIIFLRRFCFAIAILKTHSLFKNIVFSLRSVN